MPILDIEIVGEGPKNRGRSLGRRLADEAGNVFGREPGSTWVRVRSLPAADYAENGVDEAPQPVFVRVLEADDGSVEERRSDARLLARAIAGIVDRPVENVHVLYEPAARGRIAFGGELRD